MDDKSELLMPAATHMGAVTLYVADLDKVMDFYHRGVGLEVFWQENGRAALGRDNEVLLYLEERPALSKAEMGSAGLYHTAILFKTKPELAIALYSTATKFPGSYTGSADHLVSNAFYFNDPEGNGVELYWDRPRDQWDWSPNGEVKMATIWLDPNRFIEQNLGEATDEEITAGVLKDIQPANVGHVHLQVGNIPQARDFYVGKMGFDVTAAMGNQALFTSAGGYHHHIGMNTWNSAGAGMRSPALGLGQMAIVVPTAEDLAIIESRLKSHDIAVANDGKELEVRDPWGNLIKISL